MPRRLYVYNDLPYCPPPAGCAPTFTRLLCELRTAVVANTHIRLIAIDEQIEKLAREPVEGPFGRTIAAGAAGHRVAKLLHERTGWFPSIETIAITREERSPGRYAIASTSSRSLDEQLSAGASGRTAIVDDTIYSGLTLVSILELLPEEVVARTEVFCLQAIGEALPRIQRFCPVHVGLIMAGEVEKDVSIVKASHLFEPGAIRRADGPDLAFFERSEWMHAWFPRNADKVIDICSQLQALQAEQT